MLLKLLFELLGFLFEVHFTSLLICEGADADVAGPLYGIELISTLVTEDVGCVLPYQPAYSGLVLRS